MQAFWNLNTERLYEFSSIPWSKIVEYGHHVGLDDDIVDTFVALLRAMDASYLGWASKELDRQREHKRQESKAKRAGE